MSHVRRALRNNGTSGRASRRARGLGNAWLLLALSWLPACSDDAEDTTTADAADSIDARSIDAHSIDAADAQALDAPDVADAQRSDASASACEGSTRLSIQGALTVSSTDATVWKNGSGGVIGISGRSSAGKDYWFRRDGDLGDGSFSAVQTYDVSAYPYRLNYIEAAAGSDCSEGFGVACTGFHARAGSFTVTEVSPVFRAVFELSDLYADDDPSGPIVGTISGCVAVPNP